jgi:tetratricopeptide (TPR) repeat protein
MPRLNVWDFFKVGICLAGLGLWLTGCATPDTQPGAPGWARQDDARYAFVSGQWAQQHEDWPAAAAAYRSALQADPYSLTLWQELIFTLMEMGQARQAVDEFKAAAEQKKNDPAWVYLMGEAYDAAGNTAEAEANYRRAATSDNPTAAMVGTLGVLLAEEERWEEAMPWLTRALALDPHHRGARRAMVQHQIDRGAHAQAHALLQQALDADAEDPEWMLRLAKLRQLENKPDEARKIYERVLKEDPDNLDAHRALAEKLMEQQAWAGALEHLEFLSRHQPADGLVKRNLAAVYFEMGQWDEARSILQALIEQHQGDALTHFMLGTIYRQKHLWHLAVQELSTALRSPGLRIDAGLELAQAYLELQESDKAVELLESMHPVLGDYAQRWLRYAIVLLRLGKPAPALEALQQAEKLEPHDVQVLFQQGRAYLALKQVSKALEHWERAVRRDPGFAEAFNHLAYTCAENNLRLTEAEVWARRAVLLDPDNGNYRDSLGWVYYQQGKYPEALKALQGALEKFKTHPEDIDPAVYEHLGDVCQKLDQNEVAGKAWEQALKLNPDNIRLQEKIKSHIK